MKKLPDQITASATSEPLAIYDPDLPMKEYHESEALSRSGIIDLLRSPAHFYARNRDPKREERKATSAMEFGTMIHMAVLEPKKFAESYKVGPDVKTKAVKAWKDAVADNPGITLIKPAEMKKVKGIMEAVATHPAVSKAGLLDGKAEVSYLWEDGGREYRVRPDLVTNNGIVVDLKTTTDASYETFMRHAWNMGYHIQAPFYMGGVKAVHAALGLGSPHAFVQIVVEVEIPFAVQVFAPDEALMALGRLEIGKAITLLDECERTGRFPAYSDKIEILSPPAWAGV